MIRWAFDFYEDQLATCEHYKVIFNMSKPTDVLTKLAVRAIENAKTISKSVTNLVCNVNNTQEFRKIIDECNTKKFYFYIGKTNHKDNDTMLLYYTMQKYPTNKYIISKNIDVMKRRKIYVGHKLKTIKKAEIDHAIEMPYCLNMDPGKDKSEYLYIITY